NALLRRERAAERDRAVAEREQRAAEQRAKSISITGTARNADQSVTDEPAAPTAPAAAPAAAPAESTPANESRP
ncbi:MAG: hypothetical protein ACKO2S_07090, partial [Burkholderiaceae bacterium]